MQFRASAADLDTTAGTADPGPDSQDSRRSSRPCVRHRDHQCLDAQMHGLLLGHPVVATSSRCAAFAKAPERLYLGGVSRGHSRKKAAAASQGFLVDDALQRSPPVQPQPTQDLLARDEEQLFDTSRTARSRSMRARRMPQVDARRPSVVQLTTPRSVGCLLDQGVFRQGPSQLHLQTFRGERLIGQ
jgi:hypothetical protein